MRPVACFLLLSVSLLGSNVGSVAASPSIVVPENITGLQRIGVDLPELGPGKGAGVAFVDALQQAASWSSSTGQALSLDDSGNVAFLLRGQRAVRTVYAGEAYPVGDYALFYDGTGAFDVAGGAIVAQAPGRATVRVADDSRGGLRLGLVATDPNDRVRNVHLILPGFEATYATHPFAPAFVQTLQRWNVLRFANWTHGDRYASSAVWPLRPRVSRATQVAPDGVAPEYAIALANETGAAPWFTLPVGATDAYIYGFADLVHRTLDPRLRPIFEYGSEVWKRDSPANAYAAMAGRNAGLAVDPASASLAWYARRATQAFAIVQIAFGPDARHALRVLAGPSALAGTDGAAIDAYVLARAGRSADAFAIFSDGRTTTPRDPAIEQTEQLALTAHLPSIVDVDGALWADTSLHLPPRVQPLPNVRLIVGGDVAPERETVRSSHAAPSVTPLRTKPIEARSATHAMAGRVRLVGARGTPLERVDLTAEGTLDWIHLGRAASVEQKAGRSELALSVAGVGSGRLAPTAFERFVWRDGRIAARGDAAGDGVLASSAGSGFTLAAPADATERVLRVYVDVERARAEFSARVPGVGSYADASLESRVGTRSAVYTLVYRGGTGRQRLVVTFRPQSLDGSGGGVALRAATLSSTGAVPQPGATGPFDELTYHNDLLRTGWNPNETVLNASNVASSQFKKLQTLAVDGNVLAQPLYVAQYPIPGQGTHNVLVVATEHDSLYEFDADTGMTIGQISFGTSQRTGDVGCTDIAPEYGITSTPVIDRASGTIYLVAATEPTSHDFHTTIHALDIGTLTDKVPPVEISASETISNGSTVSFDPQNQMNRAGLVWANGALYLGIGSHCDSNAGAITGWILKYDSGLNQTGTFATAEDTTNYFLASVWMSGFAPAVDAAGNLFFVTGNGAFDARHGGRNYGESALKLTANLATTSAGYFTPHEWRSLNQADVDFGSGGIMLLPTQTGPYPNLAVAMGKSAKLYLLDRDQLGGVSKGDHGALGTIQDSGGGVWGGPAYYSGPTGQFIYYQTDSDVLHAYALQEDASGRPSLSLDSSGNSRAGYGGSTPIVSSNGQVAQTGIVWLVRRSGVGPRALTLEAYDASDVSKLLFQAHAGKWSNPANNGFVTPLVANGKVYVAGTNAVTVFGLGQ